ncbi:MAG: hypothetical protein ACTSRS_09720 [Candidatus Helarchaeota archaeon]
MRYSKKLKKDIRIWLEKAGRTSDLKRVEKSINRFYIWGTFFSAIYIIVFISIFAFYQEIPHNLFGPTLFTSIITLLILTVMIFWPVIDYFENIFDELYPEYIFQQKYQDEFEFTAKYNFIDHPNIYALLGGKIIVTMEYFPNSHGLNIVLEDPQIKARLLNYLKFFILPISPILIFFSLNGIFLAFQVNLLNLLSPTLTLIIVVILMCSAIFLFVVARDLFNISELKKGTFIQLSVDSKNKRVGLYFSEIPRTNYYSFDEIKAFNIDISRPMLKSQLILILVLKNGNVIPIIKCNSNNRRIFELIISRLQDFLQFELI